MSTVANNFEKATTLLRKGALAYVGMNVVVLEEARKRFDEALKNSDKMMGRFVAKGEEMEAQAGETLQDVRALVQDRVQGFVPAGRKVEIKVETKATKKASKKKTATKKTAAKKKTAKKPAAKKAQVKATVKTTKKAA